MKTSVISFAIFLGVGATNTKDFFLDWHPAGPKDSRGPCPMLNTLANHKFLPHDGRNFTLDKVTTALKTALNISEEISSMLHEFALTTNPNASTWGLDTLSTHNILEHDASLSRADAFFANDPVSFNATVFEQTTTYWTDDMIDIQMAADARLARMIDSVKYNPAFALSPLAGDFSAGEGAAYLLVFGNKTEMTARKDLVTYLFENERLPTELGWTIPSDVISLDDLFGFSDLIINATKYQEGYMKMKARRGHGMPERSF